MLAQIIADLQKKRAYSTEEIAELTRQFANYAMAAVMDSAIRQEALDIINQ